MHSAMALTRAYTLRGCAMSASDNGSGAGQSEREATVNGGEWYTAQGISRAWEILSAQHSDKQGDAIRSAMALTRACALRGCATGGSDNNDAHVLCLVFPRPMTSNVSCTISPIASLSSWIGRQLLLLILLARFTIFGFFLTKHYTSQETWKLRVSMLQSNQHVQGGASGWCLCMDIQQAV